MASKEIIEIDGIGEVTFLKRASSRNIRLSIEPGGKVRVSLPMRASFASAVSFVDSKKQWIIDKLNELPESIPMMQGQTIGKAHRLMYKSSAESSRPASRLKGALVVITHPVTMKDSDPIVQKIAKVAAEKALKIEAANLLPQRLAALSSQHNFVYKSVYVKKLKTRWGSCSSQGEIILNFYLMNLPWELIDYVLLHELTHTKFMHHQKPFWDHMEQVLPTWKLLRNSLKTHHNY